MRGHEMIPDKTNPKDLIGVKKVSTFVFPSAALLHGSHAMMNGASKYGPYNWREKKVKASIYLDALERHITSWKEREEIAEDSGVHHLGHALACIAIIIDAMETGNLVDDRPVNGQGTLDLLDRLNEKIRQLDIAVHFLDCFRVVVYTGGQFLNSGFKMREMVSRQFLDSLGCSDITGFGAICP